MEQTEISTNLGYEYRHKNGEIHRARDVYEAIGRCTFLGDMEQSEAELALELYAIGSNKIAGDALTLADDEEGELAPEALEVETVDSHQPLRVDAARESSIDKVEPKPGNIKSDNDVEVMTAEVTDINHHLLRTVQGSGSAVNNGGQTVEISNPSQDRSGPPVMITLEDNKIHNEAYASTPWQRNDANATTPVSVTRPAEALFIEKPVLLDEYRPSKVQETMPQIKKEGTFITPAPIIIETKITDKYEGEYNPIHNKPEADAPNSGLDFAELELEPKIYKESSQTAISETAKIGSNTLEHSETLDTRKELPIATEKFEEIQSSDFEPNGEIKEFEPTQFDHINFELAELPTNTPLEITGSTHEDNFKTDQEFNMSLEQMESTVAMITDTIDALAPNRLIEVNKILDEITEIMHQDIRLKLLEAEDDELALLNVDTEEHIKEKFVMLFNTLGIEHTPEVVESLAKLTLSTDLVELITKINIEQPDDPLLRDNGTHEIIQKLILATDNFKRLAINSYQVGELILRLCFRRGVINYT